MKPRNILLGLCAATIVAAGWVYLQAARARAAAEEALAGLSAERNALNSDWQLAQKRVVAANEARGEAQRALAGLAAAKPAAPAANKPVSTAVARSAITPRDVLLNDPQLQTLWLASTRASGMHDYRRLFAALKLTPPQIEKFVANMMKQQEQMMDLAGAAHAQGDESKAAVDALRRRAMDEFRAAQLELLGEDGVRQWITYDQTAAVRRTVDDLAGTLTLQGAPLTAQQGEQLVAAFASAAPQLQSGGRMNPAAIDWNAVDAAVAPILDARQMALFKSGATVGGLSRQQIQLDAAVNRALEADRKAMAAPGSPPPQS